MASQLCRLFNSLVLSTTSPGAPVVTAADYRFIGHISVYNADTVQQTVTSYIVRAGGAGALDAIERVEIVSIAPGKTEDMEKTERHVLEPGDMLFLVASANSVITAHGSGLRNDP
jgi:hypothetical protein